MAYNAFISYSHSADGPLATSLQSALHSFAKPWYKLRALHIFRDQTNLAVNPALWSSIREALDQSLFFILFASPAASKSEWVAKESEYWVTRNGSSRVLIVLTGGNLAWDHAASGFTSEHTDCLPPNMLRAFPEEPLFLDLRWARDSGVRLRMKEPRFHEAVLELAATLHNRPKDELDGADVVARRNARRLAASGIAAILLISIFAFRQTRLSREESVDNRAARLAADSAKLLADNPDQAREAALLAIESNRLHPSFEGNQALRAAVSVLPANSKLYEPKSADPAERIRDMAFSPDGKLLADVRDDGSTQITDLANNKDPVFVEPDDEPAARIQAGNPEDESEDNDAAVSVAFNASGTLLASGGRDGTAHVWALPGGREVLRISHGSPISQVAFHPSAGLLVTATDDGHVRIFDVARATVLADFKCEGKIAAVSFSPGGEVIAALSTDGEVSIFDAVRQKRIRTMEGGEAGFNLAFSKDGKRLATSNGDFAFVWDVATGRQLIQATHAPASETLTPQQWIYDAAISADGKLLAYAARGDSVAHVWNVETGRLVLSLKHDSAVAAVAFSGDGTKLATGAYDGTARVWELPAGSEVQRASVSGGAEVVLFSPGGDRFAAGGIGGSVSVSEIRRADRPAAMELPGSVRCVAFSPDSRRYAIGTTSTHWSPLVRIADTAGNVIRDIEFNGAPNLDTLHFLDPNEVIAQWSDRLFLIAIDQGKVTPLPEISGQFRIDPSGRVLAKQRNEAIELYKLPGLEKTASLLGPTSAPLRAIGIEGKLVGFETDKPPNDYSVEVWSTGSKSRVDHVSLPAELTRATFNPSGATIFTAEGEKLQAWDVPSGKKRFSITASGDIDSIVPDASNTSFATLTHGHLTVWDAATGARLAQLPDMGYLRAAAFSPDSRYLIAGYDEKSAGLWLWRTSDLRDEACARITANFSHTEWQRWFPGRPYRQICSNLPAGR